MLVSPTEATEHERGLARDLRVGVRELADVALDALIAGDGRGERLRCALREVVVVGVVLVRRDERLQRFCLLLVGEHRDRGHRLEAHDRVSVDVPCLLHEERDEARVVE